MLSATTSYSQSVDFTRDIRPILSENCFFCHGPDSETREADLRLDTEQSLIQATRSAEDEVPELLRRILSDSHDEVMPPPDSNRQLSVAEKQKIQLWLREGATTAKHWAFSPIVRPPLPNPPSNSDFADGGSLIRNPIDAFVQSRLQQSALHPNPEAHANTLVRRLSLDLTGLPPDPKLVAEFLNQELDYDALVDHLLASPEFGVRMAWDWLDAARYADTNGYQGDRERTMWPWRDWVVQAFNDNMPFDEFTRWQLAGDLMNDATEEQKLATAFCRNHMINGEGGRIAEENRVEYVFDMAETTGTVWLGLTFNCCRCHDHKYDPISNEDYYRFFAFFNQTPVTGKGGDPQTAPNMSVATNMQQAKLDSLSKERRTLASNISELTHKLLPRQAEWEKAQLANTDSSDWQPLKLTSAEARNQRLTVLADNSILADGNSNPVNDTYSLVASTSLDTIRALRLEALQHKDFNNSLSRAASGNFVLTDIKFEVVAKNALPRELRIASADATFEQGNHKIENAFDSDSESGWAVYEGKRVDRPHAAVFRFEEPVKLSSDSEVRITLSHNSKHANHNLGRFRISLTQEENATLESPNTGLHDALKLEASQRTEEQQKLIRQNYLEHAPAYVSLSKKFEALGKEEESLRKSLPKVMIMGELAKPRKTYILERGLYNKPTSEVDAGIPAFLSSTSPIKNRLELADWLVGPHNPLTARVTVNRIWQMFFGTGLVKTTEDFGAQGEIPEHRELLDWLSYEFRESGWNVKALIRLIVTSHTYRQSSQRLHTAQQEVDPENRLYSRASRFRLPSWMLRDQALAVSGLLSDVRSGPATNSYQPAGVWEEATFGKKKYQQGKGDELYRRSLFIFWRRIIAPTVFFDNSTRQTCTVKTGRTNTPLHSLLTLNATTYVEAARKLAETTLCDFADASEKEKLNIIFQRLLARPATAYESKVLIAALERSRLQYMASPELAAQLLAIGDSSNSTECEPTELASWAALCLAVLNLDETLTRE